MFPGPHASTARVSEVTDLINNVSLREVWQHEEGKTFRGLEKAREKDSCFRRRIIRVLNDPYGSGHLREIFIDRKTKNEVVQV